MSVLLSTAVSQWLVARKSKNTIPFPPVCQLDLCLCCLCCLSHCLLLEDPQLLIAVPSVCCGLLCQREGCCSIQGFLQSTFLPQHRSVSTCRYCLGLQTSNETNMTFRKPYLKALKLSKVIQIRPFCRKAFYFPSPLPRVYLSLLPRAPTAWHKVGHFGVKGQPPVSITHPPRPP